MSKKILVPALGESVTEATISRWLKNEGDTISSDEPVVELETDKVNIEVPAPSDGVLEKKVDGLRGKKIIKWEPEVDLKSGIKDTVEWYFENKI